MWEIESEFIAQRVQMCSKLQTNEAHKVTNDIPIGISGNDPENPQATHELKKN